MTLTTTTTIETSSSSSSPTTTTTTVQSWIDSINDRIANDTRATPLTLILTSATASILTYYGINKLIQLSSDHPQGLKGLLFQNLMKLLEKAPLGLGSKIALEKQKMKQKIKESLPRIQNDEPVLSLPLEGIPAQELLLRLRKLKDQDQLSGKMSGTVYMNVAENDNDDNNVVVELKGSNEQEKHVNLLATTYAMFMHTNPLHYDVFLSTKKFEAEVVQMTIHMLNGSTDACGAMTSGGTESILMALKAYRDESRVNKPWIKQPEIIVPRTAHAAFDKGCHYFGIKLVHVDVCQSTFQVDPSRVAQYINKNTIALVASAPNFPQGTIDPVPQLAQLALKHDIGLHVDCCLGGFVLPFINKLSSESSNVIPKFDFSVHGVTSISADTHKYGLSTKGSSVVMFHHKDLRKHMYFLCTSWTGGIYASPSMAGSRSGAQIATCWASMMHMGVNGYVESTRKIVNSVRVIIDGIRQQIPELNICGEPVAMVVAFSSDSVNVFQVSDRMSHRGWSLNSLQYPESVHICVTPNNCELAPQFITDLKESVREVRLQSVDLNSGLAPMYGLAISLPDKSLVNELIVDVLDSTLEV